MRIKSIVSWLIGLALVGASLAFIAFLFVGHNPTDDATGGFDNVAPTLENTEDKPEAANAPEDKTLTVTIPKMARVTDAAFPSTPGDDEESLKNYAGIHLRGTGFPWEEEANVYLAGHRLGYPGYPSFLAFWDQDNLENGDEVFVTDAGGNTYTYRVFRSFVANPTDLWVTEPVPGKNILTLQTCTLPDYAQRVITQAELVKTA